jgi:hypothetical protein
MNEKRMNRRHMNMERKFELIVAVTLISLVAPVFSESPSDAVNSNRDAVNKSLNRTIIDPMDPGYVWGNPLAIDLSNLDPGIFENAAFRKDPGGLMSSMYTASISAFREDDPKAGTSNATRKAARVGLVNWPKNSS